MAHSSLRHNRKLKKLATALAISRPLAVGLLEHLWWTVYETKSIGPDGLLEGWSAEDVASSAEWDREPDLFIEELQNAGFLELTDGSFVVHHLADWAPDYVRKRWTRAGWVYDKAASVWTRPANGGQRRTTADNGRLRNEKKRNAKKPRSPPTPPGEEVWALACKHMKTDVLKTAEFRAVWEEWDGYRRGKGKKFTAPTVKRQIPRLEGFGHAGAIASLENSMTNGWQGIFEPPPTVVAAKVGARANA
jgi:hypothetical protein